ncbi:MAG: type II toxin-antitoxin system YhaV family toxin [Leptolyngbya sp. Prado105]|nr:type II toxin-antitoxin system YhaV family toxin [Leptolyngbya sp. Prado105]
MAHPLFLDQAEALVQQVDSLYQKNPQTYQKKKTAKRLAAITRLAFDVIPQDPTRDDYRQGTTLGKEYTHWFRAKFFQQYRLFFRYHLANKIILYAWVNDDDSKRAYGSKTDACRIFRSMLESNYPPDDWNILLAEAESELSRFMELQNFQIKDSSEE